MKIQELAIVFVIIILPISLLLSEYTQFQINTLNTQTLYDARLTSATYDAIKAFQLNTTNSTTSDIANSKLRDLSASVNSFRNSIMSAFKLNGYTSDALNSYIPALVYTLYDGFYIYSPYENVNYRYLDPDTGESITKTDALSSDVLVDGNGEKLYGLKPYISYSCRYKTANIDVVITYALDNYVTVQGMIDGSYVNKSGYLIDGISKSGDDTNYTITYNGVQIETERLYENIGDNIYPYAKINGTKYYLMDDDRDGSNDRVVYISNGILKTQYKKNEGEYDKYEKIIENNNSARQYYKDAYEFTEWFKSTDLFNLKYEDAYDEVINKDDGTISIEQVWENDTRKIFEFNLTTDASKNIENELSNFNQHRLAVIRHKIETNLAIAIANYNSYSGATSNIFQMPELKEDEWDQITHNIALISFLQGLPIGGKIYNGYSIVTNSESKEVVLENYIYILGTDGAYHKIGDNYFKNEDSVNARNYGDKRSAGRLNLDFERVALTNDIETYYYYSLKDYNASYNSVVMQNDVTTYDDIYEYVNGQSDDLKTVFYTALGRERMGKYNSNNIMSVDKLLEDGGLSESGGGSSESGGGSSESGGGSSESGGTTPELTYTITFNANGGTGGPTAITVNAGESVNLPTSTPKKEGFEFLGWDTSSSATSVIYLAGQPITPFNMTLYAVWKVNSTPITYTVTFDANGGTGAPSSITVNAGESVNLPTSTPTKEGFEFLGWDTSPSATLATYSDGQSITPFSNMTLYAVWEVNSTPTTYTITYDANGGTGGPVSQTVTGGVPSQIPLDEPTKKKTVYFWTVDVKFLGWSTNSSATTAQYQPGDTITVNGNITLYAVWEGEGTSTPVTTYTVTFDANGGTGGPTSQTVKEGEKMTIPPDIPTKTMWGSYQYQFKGWSTSNSYGATAQYQPGDEYIPTGNVTLYAVWGYGW